MLWWFFYLLRYGFAKADLRDKNVVGIYKDPKR